MENQGLFTNWLEAYGKAWIDGDPQQIVAIFSADARYYETPFDEPLHGHDAIRAYWADGAQDAQRDVTFDYTILAFADSVGLAHWRAAFTRVPSGVHVALDGILQAEFDEKGHCRAFREWWHRNETNKI